MKRLFTGLLILILLSFTVVVAQAEEETPPPPDYRGTLDLSLGNESDLGLNYRIGDKLMISGAYRTGNQTDVLKAGLHYQLLDSLGLGVGVRFDPATQVSVPYYGVDFVFPFGINLAFTGFYDVNSAGVDWTRYEAAMRIQMYESVYLFAGVRGDTGAVPYSAQEPILFLKVDGDWQWGKYGLSIQPYLYVEGILLHDYTFNYQISDRVGFSLNYKDTFDRQPHYQASISWKF